MISCSKNDIIIKLTIEEEAVISMFNGFTQQTSDFLWELSFNNERPWFLAHKDEFEKVLNQPFKALAADTHEIMREKYPDMGLQLHVARIYRDARRLFGRGPYKDHLWFSLKSGEIQGDGPMFWFEIGAADYSYGMGFYGASPSQMEAFRRLVDANPARFERLAASVENGDFRVYGEEYKRPKGDRGEIINRWYNRKRIGMEHCKDFGGELFESSLPRTLVDTYSALMPMYEFFLEFYRAAAEESEKRL